MFEFLNDADPLLKFFWYVSMPTSLVFLILTVLSFIGADATDGAGADFDGDLNADSPLQMFSLRNLINFLLGFSWGGISFWNAIENKTILIAVSVAIGLSFFIVFMLAMRQLMKLQEDNSLKMSDALNKVGTVYTRIPANKSSFGKIQISIKGSQHEFQAVTLGDEIETGAAIRVVEILDNNICLIEKL